MQGTATSDKQAGKRLPAVRPEVVERVKVELLSLRSEFAPNGQIDIAAIPSVIRCTPAEAHAGVVALVEEGLFSIVTVQVTGRAA